jgi:tRNA(adenine34) deaminase
MQSALWTDAEPAWRDCFELAWESFRAGSVPVGAVLTGPTGAIVARGRNRLREPDGPPGQLGGSFVAHGELNALAMLPPGTYPDHVLYTTLEPCLLCSAALRQSHVGTVAYAAEDPTWSGVERVPSLGPQLARHWTRRVGPLAGPLRTLAIVLHLVSAVERNARGVLACHATTAPAELKLARTLAGSRADELRRVSLEEGLVQAPAELLGVAAG